MRIRARLFGTGTQDDPFTVKFLNHTMVDVDYANMRAIIDIPDRDSPDDVPDPASPLWQQFNGRRVLIGLTPAQRLAWVAKLRRRYKNHPFLVDPDVT